MDELAVCFGFAAIGAIIIMPIVLLINILNLKRSHSELSIRLAHRLGTLDEAVQETRRMLRMMAAERAAARLASGQADPPAEGAPPDPEAAAPRTDTSPAPLAASDWMERAANEIRGKGLAAGRKREPDSATPTDHPDEDTARKDTPREAATRPERPAFPAGPAPGWPAPESGMKPRAPGQRPGGTPVVLPPAAPREPGRFEVAAREAFRKGWNWIKFGQEEIPQGVSIEYVAASQWLLRFGILILVLGVGFLLKLSIDRDWIGEAGRVGLAAAAGLGLLIGGTRILAGRYSIMGQGLMGGGITMLYFAAFASHGLYRLVTMEVAFALMVAITALSGWVSIRFRSKLVAVLGVLGGYGTPMLLSTSVPNFVGLYGYMLILGLGILWICTRQRWQLLHFLGLLCHWGLTILSLKDFKPEFFVQVMPFMAAFFVLFSTMVFTWSLRTRTRSNLLDVIALFINAVVFFTIGFRLIEFTHSREWVSVLTLGMTAFYTAHVYYCLARRVLDRELMLSFTGLAAFFLAVTMPLLLSDDWITASWSLQALVLLWISAKLDSRFLGHTAYLLYFIVLFRFAFVDLANQYRVSTPRDLPLVDYLLQMAERLAMFGTPIASLAAAWKLLQKHPQRSALAVDAASDIKGWVRDQWAVRAILSVGIGMLFVFLHLEFNRTFGTLLPDLKLPVLTFLWLAMCGLLLNLYHRSTSTVTQALLMCFVGGLLIKLVAYDLSSWGLNQNWLYGEPYSFGDAALRLLDMGAVLAFFGLGFRVLGGRPLSRNMGVLLGSFGLILLFVVLSIEVNSFLHFFVPGLRAGGISILWSVFALSLVLAGIRKNVRTLRLIGLAMFAIVSWKVFFIDLARLDQVYRIVAFIVLGILVLSGSFVYLKYRSSFTTDDGGPDKSGLPPEPSPPEPATDTPAGADATA